MALLDILLEGDPRLRQKATRVRAVDNSLRDLAEDMFDTMMDAPGIGLAAPQVGVLRRLIWVHVPANYHEDEEPELSIALANPEIVKAHGRVLAYEGCLSIPGWTAEVPRAEVVTVKGLGLDNRPVRIKARGWGARALQHEIDHLDGILFLDRVEDKSTIMQVPEEDTPDAAD
ncbi:MAG: peptide deformylase [Thermomicrobiales bacterium]|nr:peptide deformylase [Thermomicrobiales bacterium]